MKTISDTQDLKTSCLQPISSQQATRGFVPQSEGMYQDSLKRMASIWEGNTREPKQETCKVRLEGDGETNPIYRGDQSGLEKVRRLQRKFITFIEYQMMVFPQLVESLGLC